MKQSHETEMEMGMLEEFLFFGFSFFVFSFLALLWLSRVYFGFGCTVLVQFFAVAILSKPCILSVI